MKRYQIIYADPPWSFDGNRLNRATNGKEITDHYPVMKDEEILQLPVKQISHKDCWLFLWIVYYKLPLALNVINTWGFKYSTVAFEWLKKTPKGKIVCFMGGTVCGGGIELCLLGKRGNLKRQSKSIHRLICSPRRQHSQKPDEAKERIVNLVGDKTRIELFAREKTPGWDVWGNEVKSNISLI